MSYAIDITAETLPDDDAGAWAVLEVLRASSDQDEYGSPPGQHFLPLYEKLTARYPCITQPEGSGSPWSDGPLISNFGKKHAVLGLSSSQVRDALPFVIETATELGFTVFDPQDEKIHRPGDSRGMLKNQASHAEYIQAKKPWWKPW